MCTEKKCCHLKYARNGAENKTMEKRMILPTQAFLEDIDLPEEDRSDGGQEVEEAETEQGSPVKNEKGKKKFGRPAKNEKRNKKVRNIF